MRDYRLTYEQPGCGRGESLVPGAGMHRQWRLSPPTVFGWVGNGTLPDFDTSLATHRTAAVIMWLRVTGTVTAALMYSFSTVSRDLKAVYRGRRRSHDRGQFCAHGLVGRGGKQQYQSECTRSACRDWNGDGKTDLARETIQISGIQPLSLHPYAGTVSRG